MGHLDDLPPVPEGGQWNCEHLGGEPLVFRGVAFPESLTPASFGGLIGTLRGLGRPRARVRIAVGEPEIRGSLGPWSTTGANFQRRGMTFVDALDALAAETHAPTGRSFYIDGVLVAELLPALVDALAFPGGEGMPRLWLGSGQSTAAHFDVHHNLARVLYGTRRFVLMPPDQLPNLYPGPIDMTPGGTVTSLVDLDRPDFDRFPNARIALEHALRADLGVGDAIYIPSYWWHQVRAVGANALVNQWWGPESRTEHGRARTAFLHALVAIRELSPESRSTWRSLFDYYVFTALGRPYAADIDGNDERSSERARKAMTGQVLHDLAALLEVLDD